MDVIIHLGVPSVYIKCNMCNERCFSELDLSLHTEKIHHTRKAIKCPKCGDVTDSEQHLKEHMKSKHQSVHKCTKCNVIFTNKSKFDAHEKNNHIQYQCQQCYITFENLDHLKGHNQNTHDGQQSECDQCDHKETTFVIF